MNTDLMIDLETLATSPNSAVLTIGAVRFDPFGNDIEEEKCDKIYIKVDLDSCDELKLDVNASPIRLALQYLPGHQIQRESHI